MQTSFGIREQVSERLPALLGVEERHRTVPLYLLNSLEMDDSQIAEAGIRPIPVSSPSPHYAAPSPSASRPLSPGGEYIYTIRYCSILQHTLSPGCLNRLIAN